MMSLAMTVDTVCPEDDDVDVDVVDVNVSDELGVSSSVFILVGEAFSHGEYWLLVCGVSASVWISVVGCGTWFVSVLRSCSSLDFEVSGFFAFCC